MNEETNQQRQRRDSQARDARHAAVGGATNLLNVVGALALPVFHTLVARWYGAATYGLYSVGVGLSEIFGRLGAMGTDKGLLRHVAAHRVAGEDELERRSLGTALWLTLISGVVLTLLTYGSAAPLAHLQHKPDAELAVRLLSPATLLNALVLVLISATMGAKVLRYNLLVRGVAQPFLLLMIAIPVGIWRPSLPALCLSHLMAMLLVVLFAAGAVRIVFPHIRWRETLVARPPHWELVSFSLPMGVSEFLNGVLHRAGLVLLGFFVDERTVGVYAAVEMLSRAIASARNAFDSVVSPVLSEAIRQRDDQRIRFNLQLMTRWVTLLTFPVIIVFVGFRNELLALFGPAFPAGGNALIVLSLGYFANGVLGLTGWVLAMSGRSRLLLFNNLIAAASNVLLCLTLAPRYGILGAAIAAAFGLVLIQLLLVAQVHRMHGIHAFSASLWRTMLAGGLTLALAIFALPRLPGAAVLRIAYGTVGIVACFVGAVWTIALEPGDRELVDRLLAKLKRRR